MTERPAGAPGSVLMPGLSARVELTVTDADTAQALGSGDVPVLGTPRVLALVEAATVAATATRMASGQTSVGTRVELEHLAGHPGGPDRHGGGPPGQRGGPSATFDVVVHDGDAVAARGRVERVVVDRQRFLARRRRSEVEMGLVEIAAEVYLLRQPVLDVNATLVVGARSRSWSTRSPPTPRRPSCCAAVRAVTLAAAGPGQHPPPLRPLLRQRRAGGHSPGCPIWAHEAAAAELREHGPRWQREWYDEWLPTHPDLAGDLAAVTIVPPDRTLHDESMMDIGGRTLELRHLGRGHTEGDLVVAVPDALVLLAGDLVEQSGPPSFGDSFPIDWPETLAGPAAAHLARHRRGAGPRHAGRPRLRPGPA